METMKRGELARRCGLTAEAVRFYESAGLLPAPPRAANGYRLYDESYVERILLLRLGQRLGFALAEIKQLFEAREQPYPLRADLRDRMEAKRAEMTTRICELDAVRRLLTDMIDACEGDGSIGDCLEQLDRRVLETRQ